MMHTDLRNWLEEVEQHKQLKRISGASCDLELGGICEIMAGKTREQRPSILFDDIPGYPKGFRILCGVLGSAWRLAKALDLPEDKIDRMNLLRNWHKKAKGLQLLPPKVVASAPIQANVDEGDKVDLLKFPVPRLHELDGGRYISTCCGVIQRDPDSGYVNVGTYRIMLVDRNRLALHILEGQHGSIIMHKYFARGQAMPVALTLGIDPTLWFASCHRAVPWGVSEYDYAGGIKGQAFEVIEGKYTKLPLPARAEIVIEGECHPGDLVDEGPFGEYHGYYGNLGLASVPEPVIRVKAVHYRSDPIMTVQYATVPYLDDSTLISSIGNSEGIWNRLEGFGIPGIKGVWCHSEVAGDGLFSVISLEQLYPGHSREAGLIASQYPMTGRYTIVVEEDIDPSNLEQVIWAMATRAKPDQSIEILHRCRSNSSDPTISIEEKKRYKIAPKPLNSSRVVIDACRPLEWKEDWYPMAKLSPELRAKILEKWEGVLFDSP